MENTVTINSLNLSTIIDEFNNARKTAIEKDPEDPKYPTICIDLFTSCNEYVDMYEILGIYDFINLMKGSGGYEGEIEMKVSGFQEIPTLLIIYAVGQKNTKITPRTVFALKNDVNYAFGKIKEVIAKTDEIERQIEQVQKIILDSSSVSKVDLEELMETQDIRTLGDMINYGLLEART